MLTRLWGLGLTIMVTSVLSSCQTTASDMPKGDHTQRVSSVSATSTDGVKSYGETFDSNLAGNVPLILLFHQGGSNARGEYAEIADWLQTEGYATLAWDTRSGGQRYGSFNRTLVDAGDTDPWAYCEAYPDLEAALSYVERLDRSGPTIAWGSSFSGALVFQLAAKNPDSVSGVMAFSPAAGDPLKDCMAKNWAMGVKAPMLALRTISEMESESGKAQKEALQSVGVDYMIVDDGIHGSSMLLDTRTKSDMSVLRRDVLDWLRKNQLSPNP